VGVTNFKSNIDRDVNKISFADIQYIIMQKLFDLRTQDDISGFQRGVTALEQTLEGIKDDIYLQDLNNLENEAQLIFDNFGQAQRDTYYFDKKHGILSALINRFNAGMLKVREYLDQSELVRMIASEMNSGIGQIVFISGPQGSGKSWSAVALAQSVLQKTGVPFSIKNVVFDSHEFFKAYNNKERTPEKSYLLFEEIGVNASSKDSLSKTNKILMKVSQTIRYRKLLLILTAPDISFVDKTLRKQLHFMLETEKMDRHNGYCYLKPFRVKNIQRTGDLHYVYLKNNDGNQVTQVRIGKLNKQTADAYEKRQIKYKDTLAQEAELELQAIKEKQITSKNVPITQRANFIEYDLLRNKGLGQKDAYERVGLSRPTARKYDKLREARKKEQLLGNDNKKEAHLELNSKKEAQLGGNIVKEGQKLTNKNSGDGENISK